LSRYFQITFEDLAIETSELLIAKLSEIGFGGFEEDGKILKAFISSDQFNESMLNEIVQTFHVNFSQSIIEETNWNQLWESNFEPVIIDDFVAIRADFHKPIKDVQHEIIITPKMSFGTGHHATTKLMIQQMREIDFVDKSVFDFGTGTCILSIVAEKLGASGIVAADNDDWSIENSKENIQRNNCTKIDLRKSEIVIKDQAYHIILTNINKNVILNHFSTLINQLTKPGVLLISGIIASDQDDILNAAAKFSLQSDNIMTIDSWMCIRFRR